MQLRKEIVLFADGACLQNPGGPGGWGAIVALESSVVELGGHAPETTNNRMEIESAIVALSAIPEHARGPVNIFTDSMYLIDSITKWLPNWKRRGWQTKENTPVKNRDQWERLEPIALRFGNRLRWKHVPSHRGIPGNERVDEIAASFARKLNPQLFDGPRAAYNVDVTSLKPRFAKKPFQYRRPPQRQFDPVAFLLDGTDDDGAAGS